MEETMATSNHPGRILPRDIDPGDADEAAIVGLEFNQSEVEDLLYGDDRPVEARLRRLDELASELRLRGAADLAGDNDTGALLSEIERAMEELSDEGAPDIEPSMLDVVFVDEPENHRETLAPDSDELAAIKAEDEKTDDEDD
jgi:hypothetical protein